MARATGSKRRQNTNRREFGAVELLPSGRWRARYTGPDGRQRSGPTTFPTRADADRWLTVVRADMLRGQWSSPELADVTLSEYTTAWLRGRAPSLRPRTQDLYARGAERWLSGPVGTGRNAVDLSALPLRVISPPIVRDWFAAVTDAARTSALARTGRIHRTHPARAWATSHGIPCAATGRLSPTVLAAWHKAGSPDMRTRVTARPAAGRTAAAQAYRLLHAITTQAVDDGLLTVNPVRIQRAGHVNHPERMPLTPLEVEALAATVPDHYRAAVLVAAWSGLRPGEVFALTRQDVEASLGHVTVRRTLTEVPGQPVAFGPPKTAAGRRVVALPTFVAEALNTHLQTYTSASRDALVFTTLTGSAVTSPARSKVIANARVTIGRPDITWHHLRHTGATLAAQAGATQAELQRRIGHSSPRAAALYQHATLERDHTLAIALHNINERVSPLRAKELNRRGAQLSGC